MLSYNPEERLSAEDVLNNKWFNILGSSVRNQPLNINALKNLENFNSERKLQGAIFQYIAN